MSEVRKRRLFAVSPFIQKELVNKLCFGSCGRVLCGGLDCGDVGPCFPCREDNCPHEKGRMKFGSADFNGKKETVFIRALKEAADD